MYLSSDADEAVGQSAGATLLLRIGGGEVAENSLDVETQDEMQEAAGLTVLMETDTQRSDYRTCPVHFINMRKSGCTGEDGDTKTHLDLLHQWRVHEFYSDLSVTGYLCKTRTSQISSKLVFMLQWCGRCESHSPHVLVWWSSVCAARVCRRWLSRCPDAEFDSEQVHSDRRRGGGGRGRSESSRASSSSLWVSGAGTNRKSKLLLKSIQETKTRPPHRTHTCELTCVCPERAVSLCCHAASSYTAARGIFFFLYRALHMHTHMHTHVPAQGVRGEWKKKKTFPGWGSLLQTKTFQLNWKKEKGNDQRLPPHWSEIYSPPLCLMCVIVQCVTH